jgi:hypothetical protein
MNEQQVLDLVRKQLTRHHPGGVTLDIGDGSVRRQDEYWYVPVRPSAQPPKMYEYYEALAEVEATLEENEGVQVFLVPTLPEEAGVPPAVATTSE